MTEQPAGKSIPMLLSGPMPVLSGAWCATCVMLYGGAVSMEPEFRRYAKELTETAVDAGHHFVSIDFPDRDDLQLQPAITVGPSWVLNDYRRSIGLKEAPYSPVCWTHVAGIPPREYWPTGDQQEGRSGLVRGKAYGESQYRG